LGRHSKKLSTAGGQGASAVAEGMRRTYSYAAVTKDAAQRSKWTFYEAVNKSRGKALTPWEVRVNY